jgi:hypothetical protein
VRRAPLRQGPSRRSQAVRDKDERAAQRILGEMPGVKKAAEDAFEAVKMAVRGDRPAAAVRKVG